jgi:hypothetical protein
VADRVAVAGVDLRAATDGNPVKVRLTGAPQDLCRARASLLRSAELARQRQPGPTANRAALGAGEPIAEHSELTAS